jgi:drug/metabolite transporter (DMT)-like permease
MTRTQTAYLQLALAMTLVGANIGISRALLDHLPTFTLGALRFLIACLVLFPLVAWRGELRLPGMRGRDYLMLFLQGLFGVFLFNLFSLSGIQYTTAASAGIITSTLPATIALLALVILRERLAPARWVGVALAVIGVGVINLQGAQGNAEGSNPLLGNTLIFGAVLSEAIFAILARALSGKVLPFMMAAAMNLIGLLLFTPVALTEVGSIDWAGIPSGIWVLLLIYALTASVISFALWFSGAAAVPANRAGLFTGFLPVSAVLVGALFLGEQLTLAHAIGMACVLVGIALGTVGDKATIDVI